MFIQSITKYVGNGVAHIGISWILSLSRASTEQEARGLRIMWNQSLLVACQCLVLNAYP